MEERVFEIGGRIARIRVAGNALAPRLLPALAHLESKAAGEPALTLLAWDDASTGARTPPFPAGGHAAHHGSLLIEEDGYLISFAPCTGILTALDPSRRSGVYWIQDARNIPWWEQGSPLRVVLHGWLKREGLQVAHAAAVGTDAGGVLLVGKGGAGKSTTTLACLGAGFQVAGDDYVLLDDRDGPRVHSLFQSTKLDADALRRLPALAAQLPGGIPKDREKALIFLRDIRPEAVSRGFPVRAILVLRITPGDGARLASIPAADALQALAPSTIHQLPGAGPEDWTAMERFVRQTPCFALETGANLERIPEVIRGLLASPPPPPPPESKAPAPPAAAPRAADACSPSESHALLLRAILGRGEEAPAAFRAWRETADLDRLDRASFRMLPLLHRSLSALGVQDPWMERLRAIRTQTEEANRFRFRRTAGILRDFSAAGIRCIVLKGTALSRLHYRDDGVRPMDDLDILVRTPEAEAAIGVLEKAGFAPRHGPLHRFGGDLFSTTNGHTFAGADGFQIDLHWHLLPEGCHEGADDPFWAAAIPFEIEGATASALDPTDALFHVCSHGTRWSGTQGIRWIADARAILETAGSGIDWSRLVEHARRFRTVLSMAEALERLREYGTEIPEDAIAALRKAPVSRLERMEFETRVRPSGWLGRLPSNLFLFLRQFRRPGSPGEAARRLGPFRFLRIVWMADRLWKIPLILAGKAVAVVRKLAGHRKCRGSPGP